MTYYDEIAKGYDNLHKAEQLRKLEIIKENLKIKKNDFLLDVGCGTGISTEFWDCKKIGIDPSVELLKQNLDKKNSFYLEGKAEDLPFKSHLFDVVISVTAIHNFKDYRKGLREIKRVGEKRFALTLLKKA
ncbi:MAG: methyltransferase domain-containing protein, partial [Nanoarchaeota archaeon]|nr:methyltransferase domain-containing protein [Nanoarchaeota archaeon]